jgi:hypothetical protein
LAITRIFQHFWHPIFIFSVLDSLNPLIYTAQNFTLKMAAPFTGEDIVKRGIFSALIGLRNANKPGPAKQTQPGNYSTRFST